MKTGIWLFEAHFGSEPITTRKLTRTIDKILATTTTAPTMATSSPSNICIICRRKYQATSCCIQTATSSSSYTDSSSYSGSKKNCRSKNRNNSNVTPATFPSQLASVQHLCCPNYQQHQLQQHEAVHSNYCINSSNCSSNSTNDNNQKVTATTSNCHCNHNCINNNNINNHRQKQQHFNINSKGFNILRTLQLLFLFAQKQMLLQRCCNLFKRHRGQQPQPHIAKEVHSKLRYQQYQHYYQLHHFWRHHSIVFLIVALLTMHATTTIAIQLPTPMQLQDQHLQHFPILDSNRFANSMESFMRERRDLGRIENNNMRLTRKEIPCKSMDVRNTISELSQLANCTVIEGFLLISLINDGDKLNQTFPMLTEVTGFVVVYRVNNLLSLSQVFPNLRVIRGNILFESYALVVYQNRDLQDIGLTNLRAITNGGVRIEKNNYLCFIKTINWRQIVSKNLTEHDIVLKLNRKENECARCPGDVTDDEAGKVSSEGDATACEEHSGNNRYCWTGRACQTICPKSCPYNCIDEHTCCDNACLGGCIKSTKNCISCRKFSIDDGKCTDKCPDNYFQYENRCITAKMCEEIGSKFEGSEPKPLVHFNGKCTTRCDKGYEIKDKTCRKCAGECERECEGGLIDSSAQAKTFHGCTKIGIKNGLTISVKRVGPHVLEALVFGLGRVHTISTYLKVHLTYGLTSLDFFKNLRNITGNQTVDNRYALYVLENQDLESIWGENQTVTITKGSVFFHFNAKLCLETIDKLKPMLPNKPETFNSNEVAADSNGNKGTCNTLKMDVKVGMLGSLFSVAQINTSSVKYDDDRALIGYQVYYTPDPYKNATRENNLACSTSWLVTDPDKSAQQVIPNLLAYTNYAFYVRTMTISAEKRNYQSEIVRFKTLPDQPTSVRKITARSPTSSQILLSWLPPLNVKGKLLKYQVRVELIKRDSKLEHHRNFCRDPLPNVHNTDESDENPPEKTAKETPNSGDCVCEETGTSGQKPADQRGLEENIFDEIEFENALQNAIYVAKKRKESKPNNDDDSINSGDTFNNGIQRRRRRYIETDEDNHHTGSVLMRHIRTVNLELNNLNKSNVVVGNNNTRNTAKNADKDKEDFIQNMNNWKNLTVKNKNYSYYEVFSDELDANKTEYLFTNLKHFSLYVVTVRACRQNEGVLDTYAICSKEESWTKRTQKLPLADLALEVTADLVGAVNTTRAKVQMHWVPPPSPNGAIVSYTIIYERLEQFAVPEKRCITVKEYQNQSGGYLVENLNEGKYTFRVTANSLAGEGDRTKPLTVIVPPPSMSVGVIISIVAGTVAGLLCIILAVYFFIVVPRKRHPQVLTMNTEVNPFYASLQYVPDDWEVPRERIIQLGPLGQGSFGMVYEGILKAQNSGDDIPCAIKTVNENATDRERSNFLTEASVMKEFDTYHVVRLLGVCSIDQPALVVMELMKKGDLKSYLRAHRPDEREDVLAVYQQRIGLIPATSGGVQPPPYSRIFQMAIEIADGMAYLAAKKFVHRDLAARNCMVAEDLTVKIGDFGMTRDIYQTDYYRKGTKGLLPVRWMPPESLRDGVYASSSDVFSYGVVLWEMATLASQPYQGLSNEQVLRYVIDGGIMERPDNCPELMHKLMHRCWHHRPSARPSFLDIIAYLEHLAEPTFNEVAFYYSKSGLQYREKERKERNQADIFSGGRLDAEADAEDATTPLRVGEYQGYKSNMENNSSVELPAESPIALVDDQTTTHSPFSIYTGFMVSSTPDALSTLPTAGGSHVDDAAYVQPDADVDPTKDAERGYEQYDPSPNFAELPHSGCGRLSGEQHLLPKKKRGGASITPSMSSSMPDEMIVGGGVVSTSLQPSTASASSNASSSRNPSLKRVVADTLRNRGYGLLTRFNHKRSGSNASHKSNISNAPSSSSNTNLTSHPAGMAMVSMGPNLGTIESGGSGSAGSYVGTPRFYTPTATTPNTGGNGSTTIISDNPNYKLLDESTNSVDPVNSVWSPQLTTSSLNPNYELMQPPMETAGQQPFMPYLPHLLIKEPGAPPNRLEQVLTSDNPNYVAMQAPVQMPPSSSDGDENDEDDDDEDADEHTEHIKMERMPLSRQKQRTRIKPQQQQQPRSRSVSQTRKGETTTPTQTQTAAPAAALTAIGNSSNILKENWLKQTGTPRPPPPNGFIGREA